MRHNTECLCQHRISMVAEVIRTPWRLKPLAIERLFIQQLVRVYNKEHIKDVHCWIFVKENATVTGHYNDVIMRAMAYQTTSLTIVYPIVYSGTNQRKHQSSASLAFVRGIHRRPVDSPHKWPVTRKMFPFDDVIMRPVDSLIKGLQRGNRLHIKTSGMIWQMN